MPKVRKPTHSGSWYESNYAKLKAQIGSWMQDVQPEPGTHAQAIIAPHAGYSYSGHVMAYAYKHIDPSNVSRVFLLGPSHKLYTRKCLLSSTQSYETPLGSMQIDQEVCSQLLQTGEFEMMDVDTDEAEHSLELHTPYIVHIMGGKPFSLVPIMVGALSTSRSVLRVPLGCSVAYIVHAMGSKPLSLVPIMISALSTSSEAKYGALLAPYLNDPSNCFIISSDFCHWGRRFSYTFFDQDQGPIWKSIQWLDKEGMDAIESQSPQRFADYLSTYRNTICGRHPIAVLLNVSHP
ncbi:MEMO1 family [Dunaliella salina]|uniref:MEMO1 family n=1 Tax=Dunaliella salina TaxID=3046 RepID=A0ABQ7GE20_DUNSA|nr:MEMO1 family [Dunaliella salina]|eukprot:KAF5832861.1 MEMO1 family [Dunaliella salina]